ncbi:LysR family transcriptional regulator [Mangrovicoccus ximenensis]|uniref:LysR family transcriptional regulator n=1 Tax=Mangrovicoccus ximenensis TaxID=1911570 RepID=UPI000D36364C|nr:LysR family transcriptional regulator [Mangrovicoccus ximenensis]
MDLRQIRYFVAVAEERNFTRAAETLNIAQPPLSRQIQMLEEELGTTLILRGSRPLRLTDAGRLFQEQALQVLGRVEQMAEATRRVGRNQNRVVKIGFVPSTLYGGLPSLVRKMRHAAPGLDIRLVEMVSLHQIHALKEGRIDLGFGRLRHSDPAVTGIVLREERLAVAIPQGDPLAASDAPLPVRALAGTKLIVYPKEPRPSYADHVLRLLHGHDVRPCELEEVSELQTALGLVAAEVGLCIVPSSARRLRADIRYRILEGARATSPVVLSHRASDSSDYIAMVKDLIDEMYAENPPWLTAEHNLSVRGDPDPEGGAAE